MIPRDNEREEGVKKKYSKNYNHETKGEENSFEDTHMTENKPSTRSKRKQLDHLEAEFKKTNPPPLMENKRLVRRLKYVF
jgi:hypothetical protein